jgi:hypothetical protein
MSLGTSNLLDATCGDYLNPSAQCLALYSSMQAAVGQVHKHTSVHRFVCELGVHRVSSWLPCLLLLLQVNAYDIYTPCIQGEDKAVPWEHSRSRVPQDLAVGGPVDCIDGIAASAWINTPAVIEVHGCAWAILMLVMRRGWASRPPVFFCFPVSWTAHFVVAIAFLLFFSFCVFFLSRCILLSHPVVVLGAAGAARRSCHPLH